MAQVSISVKRRPGCSYIPLPGYETEGSVGMDIAAAVDGDVVIGPGERVLVPCGLHMALPPGYEAQLRPRSGLAVWHGISLVNTPGTIDSDYRGEIKVSVYDHARDANCANGGRAGATSGTCRGRRVAGHRPW